MINKLHADDQIVAIRSLQSAHHAHNIPPQIVRIQWNIGKRCNFDCSYCSPHYHDAVSPHIDVALVRKTVKQINEWLNRLGKRAEYGITGGEPFVHPGIIEILASISDSPSNGEILHVMSNGSAREELYDRALTYATNFTFSVHLERENRQIDRILHKIIQLKQRWPQRFFASNIVFLPGQSARIMEIKKLLEDNGINCVMRRVRPNDANDQQLFEPMVFRRDRSLAKMNLTEQAKSKVAYKMYKDQYLDDWYRQYYSQQELELLRTDEAMANYQNLGVWLQDGRYLESNSDDLLAFDFNKFTGWRCFSGTDCLYIDFDGSIYNAACHSVKLGHVQGNIQWPTGPLVCDKINCISNPDIIVRKCRDTQYMPLVTGQN